jgi:CRP-like cAMP-binding protein
MRDSPRSVSSLERLLYLKRLPTLAGLPGSELAVIADVARERAFPAGSVILREGEPIGSVHFVVEGSIRCRRAGRVLGVVGPGMGIGGLGLFARDPQGVQAEAETDTLTLELEADAVMEVLEDRFPILLHLLRDLCRQLIDAHVKLAVDPTAGFPVCDNPPLPTRELDLVERIFYMRQMAPFRESSVNVLFELSRTLTEVRFGPGVTLWETGDVAAGMFLIVSGQVAGRVPANGLRFCAASGIPLGSLEAVAEVPRWYDAVTQTEVVALNGNAEALVDVFEDNFEMAMDFLAVVARVMLRLVQARGTPEQPPGPDL